MKKYKVIGTVKNPLTITVPETYDDITGTPPGGTASVVKSVSYFTNSSQVISASATAIINFDDMEVDADGDVVVGASWAFTAPAAGTYLIESTVCITAGSAFMIAELLVYKNGSRERMLSRIDWAQGSGVLVSYSETVEGGVVLNLAEGDTIDIRIKDLNGTGFTTSGTAGDNHVSIVRLT